MAIEGIDAWLAKLAGVAGAALSMRFVAGTWQERLTMAVGGAVVSYYAAPWVSAKIGLPEGLSGFLLGLMGMAVISKAYEAIQAIPIAEAWAALIAAARDRLGGK